ncbi:serine/threonine-protein kinase fray2 isoform X1 [Drosophila rhopaloa]|uniref:Serine/threonine-protein kinase fray2 isoform X1 n=1 Tax=Drosophila rhopaloa TaxID=1041015 RepID=A0A6P4FNM3_DRORH|nr:serine/threonine-protein kinase fray2 isoform X1 [Drosophila rhopaloa]
MTQHSHTAIEYWSEFFRMYRSMPELWLVRSTLYRDRKLKDESYGRLLELMRESDRYANIHTLKRKINNFRTSYRRELRKVLESDNTYVPSLWYFKELDFLYELETGELQLDNEAAVQDQDRKLLQHHENLSEYHTETEPETLEYMQQHESEVENSGMGVDLTEGSDDDQVIHHLESEDDDIFSEPFATEEDVLRIEAVGDGDGDPEPEANQEPEPESITSLAHLKSERKADDYQATFSGSSKNMPYANHAIPSPRNNSDSVGREVTTDKAGRRIRIRRRRSSDYGEIARKRRVEEIPDRDTDRDRDRDRDRYRERDRDRDRDNRGRESESENECELIGRRMATHFRHMRPDQRLYAERIISEVLVYGRMNRLSFEARFIPGGK